MSAEVASLAFKPHRAVRTSDALRRVSIANHQSYWLSYWKARRDVYLLEARLAHTSHQRRKMVQAAKDSHRQFLTAFLTLTRPAKQS